MTTRVEHEGGLWSAAWTEDGWSVSSDDPVIQQTIEELLNAGFGVEWIATKYEPDPILARANEIAEEFDAIVTESDVHDVPDNAEA